MRCGDALRRSTAYVDGELGERASRAVRGHLRGCPRCAAAFADEAAIRAAAADLGPLEPPAAMWRGIEDRLASAEVAEARRSPLGLALMSLLDRLRRHALSGAVVATAAVLLVAWLGRADRARLLYQVLPAPAAAGALGAAGAAPGPAESIEAAFDRELVAAVSHHEAVLLDLAASLAEQRAHLTPTEATAVDAAVDAARAAIVRARAEVATPGGDQRLLAAYRTAITVSTRASSRRGALAGLPGRGR